jgi:PEP-CTERM motif
MKTILALSFLCGSLRCASAQNLIVYPTDDGSVYAFGFTTDIQYVSAFPREAEGDIHFAAFNSSADQSIELEINPYSEPLFGSQVSVYGFDNATASLSVSDYNAGTFLGTWNVAGLGFGQETFFDVTSFVKSVQGSYFGFELQSDGSDEFSSTANNYGTPPELIATVPEPSTLVLALVGLSGALLRFNRRTSLRSGWRCDRRSQTSCLQWR